MKNALAQWYLLKLRLSYARTVLWLLWRRVGLVLLLLVIIPMLPVFAVLVWWDRKHPIDDSNGFDGGNW